MLNKKSITGTVRFNTRRMCTAAAGTNSYRLRLKNKCMPGVKKDEFELEYSAKIIPKYKGPLILSMTDG